LEDCVGAIPTKGPAGTSPDFISPQLAAAMSHPTRVHAMSILRERAASPREVAKEIDERLNNVTYHINQLQKLGCVELVRTERVRGGRVLEHFYRAKSRLYFGEKAWQALTQRERHDLVSVSLRMISEDITSAMATGTIFADEGSHLSRSAMVVDAEGWREIADVLVRATSDLFEVESNVAERVADGPPADIHTRVELMQFRAPAFSDDD
jgi:DNA-binding transcriptional ArsR family regulator